MSYILDSLKKLEREKGKQIVQGDLKSLLLKADHSDDEMAELKGRLRLLAWVVGCIGLVSVVLGVGYYRSSYEPKTATIERAATEPHAERPASASPIPARTPKPETTAREEATSVVAEPVVSPVDWEDQPALPEEEAPAEMLDQPIPDEEITEQLPPDPKPKPKPAEKVLQPIKAPVPPTPKARIERVEEAAAKANFPRIYIKGVVFFGEGNPANYIIVKDETSERIKLKAGDTHLGARVTEILPQKARFTFNGYLFEKEMGTDSAE